MLTSLAFAPQAFMAKDVEEMMQRRCPTIPYDAREPRNNTQHFFVAVDPSGGGASAFSIATIVCGANGFMHVRLRLLHAHCLVRPELHQQRHQRH